MAKSNAEVTITKIAKRLHEIFDSLIDLSDLAGKPPAHVEPFFLTRSLAALSLLAEAPIVPAVAGGCVTDGGDDDGIDAVYVDKAASVIYFVQSKWNAKGNSGVALADFTRFRDGVKDVLALNWNDDNKSLHRFKVDLETALENIDTRVVMIFAQTSENPIGKTTQNKIEAFISSGNELIPDFIEFRRFSLSRVTTAARSQSRPEKIDDKALFEQWGIIKGPYEALYGAVPASDVVRWYDSYGTRLFSENLRYTIEKSSVNDGIIDTAENAPENFWYYNNGVTVICDEFHKQPVGGNSRDRGVFDLKRLSVINGAQTVGSLARAKQNGASLNDIYVHLRVISLKNTPDGFAVRVTNANNTQNDLSPVDFVAADPAQERLRKEATAQGLVYSYRRGETVPIGPVGFDIRSATIAAACSSGELRLAVASKRYISGLWEDTKKEPYTKLFNEQTKALRLWYAVQVMREVDRLLAEKAKGLAGRSKLVAVHGNRFILFVVFNTFLQEGSLEGRVFSQDQSRIKKITEKTLTQLLPLVEKHYPDAYPGNVFKNNDRQVHLLANLKS